MGLGKREQDRGVPQGSVLLPVLFNLVMVRVDLGGEKMMMASCRDCGTRHIRQWSCFAISFKHT